MNTRRSSAYNVATFHRGQNAAALWALLQVVQELSSNIIVIEQLQNFQFKDKNLRDHGENVRHRAKQLCDLVLDPERIRTERKKVQLGSRLTVCSYRLV